MKPKYFLTLIALLILTALFISCTATREPDNKPKDNSNLASEKNPNTEKNPVDIEKNLMGESSYIKSITDESAAEAHQYILEYPNGKLDKSKGSCNISDWGKYYNLVYYSDDSVQEVAEFFKKNISEDYLVETVSKDTENWIHLEYKPVGVRHSGGIYIREAGNGSTEMIYEVSIPAKQAD